MAQTTRTATTLKNETINNAKVRKAKARRTKPTVTSVVADLLILACFIVGFLAIEITGIKVITTGMELITIYSDNIKYQDSKEKTDGMTIEIREANERRQAIYNSNDKVIHWFANQKTGAKVGIMIVSALIDVCIPFFIICSFYESITNRKEKKQRRQNRK